MINLSTLNCTNCLSWIREKCIINKGDMIPLYTNETAGGLPQIELNDNTTTISTEVQVVNLDTNENPDIIVVKSCDHTSNNGSNELLPNSSRWAVPSSSESIVEDLQQNTESVRIYGHENDSTEIRMEDTKNKEWKPSRHLHKYLSMMHICGTAPLAKTCGRPLNNQKYWKWLVIFQRVFFWTVVGCAAFDLGCRSKFWLLYFLSGYGFNALVKFTFSLISLGTAIQFACILCRNQEMEKMMNVITAYEKKDPYERKMPNATPVLGIVTVVVALATQIFSFDMWDESFLQTVQYNSYNMGHDIFFWNFKNITTINDKIFDQFFKPTASNICLGILIMVRDFLSGLLMGMMWDLILIINLILSCWKHVFLVNYVMPIVDIVGTALPSDSFDARTLQTARETAFKKWREYKIVYHFVNNVFGQFLPLFHASNVLMYAFFLSICILPDETSTAIVYVSFLYDIVKAEIIYVVSSRLTQQNELIRKFLRNWAMRTGKITVDGEDWNLNALLDELNSEPLVFGTGNFAIDQRFHFGIIGLVGSLFVSLANGIGKISSGG